MDLDPMVNTSQDENSYSDYDDRPIRPMDQDALNEALARLPILVDDDELPEHSESHSSSKARRQPILAYSTRRKDFTGVNISQSVLNTTGTPMNNKRKLTGNTPTNKLIKQIDARQDLAQLKQDNKFLEEAKANLQLECLLLKKSHENELELLRHEHQQAVEALTRENQAQREQFVASLADRDQLLADANLALDSLRNDHTMLLLEKETLDKIVAEHETIVRNLREELEARTKAAPPVQLSRPPCIERPRIGKCEPNRAKPTGRGLILPLSSTTTNVNKSVKASLSKITAAPDDKKKPGKPLNPSSARPKPKAASATK